MKLLTTSASYSKRTTKRNPDVTDTSVEADALRYRHLRQKDLDTIHQGGVFAGRTPENVVLSLEDLDHAIDGEMNDAKREG